MKETVLSAKTSGTATKRFEVIVEVIKKIPPQNFFLLFLRRAFITFSELVRFLRSGSHMLAKYGRGSISLRSPVTYQFEMV